jgi:RecJ-like exonuclease
MRWFELGRPTVRKKKTKTCPTCHGNGRTGWMAICSTCGGLGAVEDPDELDPMANDISTPPSEAAPSSP